MEGLGWLTAARVRHIRLPWSWRPASAANKHRAKPFENPATIALSGQIRQLLIDGGYDERDVIVWDSAQVATGARELQQSASILAKLFGAELDTMHKHIELADAGYTFLAAYSPSDLDTKRVMNVARRFRYALAQKYERFSITEF
jgi:hypothetical protein